MDADFRKLFKIKVEFEDDALKAIAHKAAERKTGARGLKAIIEEVMEDIMYEVPSMEKVERCVITEKVVEKVEHATLITGDGAKTPVRKKRISRRDGQTA